jgi:formylmethanofuran dehydrogenase subunit E
MEAFSQVEIEQTRAEEHEVTLLSAEDQALLDRDARGEACDDCHESPNEHKHYVEGRRLCQRCRIQRIKAFVEELCQ